MVLHEIWDKSDTGLPSYVVEIICMHPPGKQEGTSTPFNISMMPYKEMKMLQLLPHMLSIIGPDNGEEAQSRVDQ